VRPLSGVKVLDATRLLPGGFCSYLLSEYGAEVVKVEEPGKGDYMRWMPPMRDGVSPVDATLNRNKRSIAIDLKKEEGKEVMRRLVRRSDVLLDGFRPGVMERLGFSFEAVGALNPRIVYCSISAFGRSSEFSRRPGHDLNFQAMSGLLGFEDPPRMPFLQLGDLAGALYATVGILAALASRRRRATLVDVPLVQSLVSLFVIPASSYFATGRAPSAGSNLLFGSEPYYNLYRTADGRYLAVAAIEPRFWKNLLAALGLSRYEADRDGTRERKAALTRRMRRVFATNTLSEWSSRLADETCVTPVLTMEEALSSPWAKSSGTTGSVGTKAVLNQPLRFGGGRQDKGAPSLGEHTRKILLELGYTRPEVVRLLATKSVA